VAVVVTEGTFEVTGGNGDGTANGTDAAAAINGVDVDDVDGNRVTFSSNGLHFEIEFDPAFTGDFDPITVSGDALTFALSTSPSHRSTLAIPGLQAGHLGGASGRLDQIASGGLVSGLDGNTSPAIRIVDEALGDLTRIEGSVDGFFNAAVTSSSNLLSDLEEDLQDAIAQTDGYDETEETLLLAKNQQLAANALAGLAVLNQQRAGIVAMIQQIAGLG
jgi:flagellin-like hook-associated protein FlgL